MNLKRKLRFYRYRLGKSLQGDPFWTLVTWAVFLSFIFLIFAFRGLIATIFIEPVGVANPGSSTHTEEVNEVS